MIASLRQTVRALGRAPAFTFAALLCIALGVGANTAVFSALSAVLLRPVATPDVQRLVVVHDEMPTLGLRASPVSPPEVLDLAARRDLFVAGGGVADRRFATIEDGVTVQYRGARTIGDFWGTFRVRPLLGRLYGSDDSRDGRHLQVVLSHAFWRERFGGDSGVVGRPMRLNDVTYTVVGVLPPEFRYPRQAQLFVPFRVDSTLERLRGSQFVTAVLRLRDDVSVAQVRGALPGLARALRERHPDNYSADAGQGFSVESFVAYDAGQLRPVLLVLAAAVGLVLLVACANVAALQLVRATARARELGVRAALGASRAQVARQLLRESAVLAAGGGALGLAVGWSITRLLVRLAPEQQLALRALSLDGPVLAACAALVALVVVLAGVYPAVRASRPDVRGVLQDGARGGTAGRAHQRVFGGVVVGQLALSLVLLLGSGLLVRSLARLVDVDPGFRAERVATVVLAPSRERAAAPGGTQEFYRALLDRLEAAPGVTGAGLVSEVPLALGQPGNSSPVQVPGRDTSAGQAHANMLFASAGYFRTLGIPLRRGRLWQGADDVRPADGPGAAMAVIVDEAFVRAYLPGRDPIGQRIAQGMDGVIVGVVGSVRQEALGADLKPTVYYNYRQLWPNDYVVVLRGTVDGGALVRAARDVARTLDPQALVGEATPLPDVVARSTATRRFGVTVLAGFALTALALALVGIYGVLSYVVAQRRRELGIRVALGATAREVRALVLGEGARLAALGVAGGLVLFLAAGRLLAAQLYGVGPRDPVTMAAGALLLGGATLAACWLPARRATRVDPMEALRAE